MESAASVSLISVLILSCTAGAQKECLDGPGSIRQISNVDAMEEIIKFPDMYGSEYSFCRWQFTTYNSEHVMKVTIQNLDMSYGCYTSSISIHDGTSTSDKELKRICQTGKESEEAVISSGRKMLVVLRVNGDIRVTFRLKYVAIEPPKDEEAQKGGWLSTGALVGGIVGAVCFVVILGIACQRCMAGAPRPNRPHRAAAFYHAHAPPPGTGGLSAAVHMVQNNNAIFMLQQATGGSVSPSRLRPTLSTGSEGSGSPTGVTNMAFNADQIQSLREATYNILAQPIGLPPPPYTESMMVTHPPSAPPSPSRSIASTSESRSANAEGGTPGIKGLVNSFAGPAALSAALGMSTPADSPGRRRRLDGTQSPGSASPRRRHPNQPTIVVDTSALDETIEVRREIEPGHVASFSARSAENGATSSGSLQGQANNNSGNNSNTSNSSSSNNNNNTSTYQLTTDVAGTTLPSGVRTPDIVISHSGSQGDGDDPEIQDSQANALPATLSQAVQTSRASSPEDFSADIPLLNRAAASIHSALSSGIRSELTEDTVSDCDDVFNEPEDGTLPPPPIASCPPSPLSTGSGCFPPPPPEALESDSQSCGAPDTDPLL